MTTTDLTLTDRAHIRIGMCSCIPPLCPNCATFAELLDENAELRAELNHFKDQSIRIAELERALAERKPIESWHGKAGVTG